MRNLGIILVLFGILCFSSAFVVNERPKQVVSCSKRIPMTEYFEHGYDISEFDTFACPEIGGKRAVFASLNTCDKGNKFKFDNQEQTEYEIPDQIAKAYLRPFTHLSVGQNYDELSDMREELIQSTAFESSFDSLEGTEKSRFKNGQFYNEMRKIFANESKIAFTFYRGSVSGMVLYTPPYEKTYFTPAFVEDVNSLPTTFNGSEKAYLDFIKKYGTHVITSARFGGVIYRYKKILKEDWNRRHEINAEMIKNGMALTDTLDTICEKKDGSRQVMKVHVKNRDYIQVMIGGIADLSLYYNRTVPLKAIHSLPALVACDMVPISKLFEDNHDKQKNIENAIKVYLAKQYIKAKITAIQVLLDNGRKHGSLTRSWVQKAKQSADEFNVEKLRELGSKLREESRELEY